MAGLREFVVEFGSEEKCIEHLAGLRWPGGFACAGCGGRQAWRLKARPRVYECAACHRQESVTAGTVDSNHRSPSEIVVDPSGSRRDHRAKYCPPGKTQHLLPNSVFDRPGSDRWNLASTTFPDAGPMLRIRFPPAERCYGAGGEDGNFVAASTDGVPRCPSRTT